MDKRLESIIDLTQQLVRIPSQGGKDPLDPIIGTIGDWLSWNSVPWQILKGEGKGKLGILATIDSGQQGPDICLDAPIDTAPVGRLEAWQEPPFEGVIRHGKMFGRGVADSKIAVSIFMHVARDLARANAVPKGRLHLLLDGDEHTGSFGGVKAFIEDLGYRPDFVALGYPGNYGVKIGARGFYRAIIKTFGTERHSGARADTSQDNAILKMAHLVQILADAPLPAESDPDFSFGPKLSITSMSGGTGFSQIPGACTANVDIRLTPSFGAEEARIVLEACLSTIDERFPTAKRSGYDEVVTWPAYKLDPEAPPVKVLRCAAEKAFQRPIHSVICGPSNIGNYLASFNIPATCGFGVSYDYQHAANEFVDLDSIPAVYQTYYRACQAWCSSKVSSSGK